MQSQSNEGGGGEIPASRIATGTADHLVSVVFYRLGEVGARDRESTKHLSYSRRKKSGSVG